jgi:hypothetical protein
MLRWVIENDAGNALLSGGTFSVTSFSQLLSASYGNCFLRFYLDTNNSGMFDSAPMAELSVLSPQFSIVTRTIIPFIVDWSTDLGPTPVIADMQAFFDAAENLILKKDTAADWRAAVDFQVTSLTTFVATSGAGVRPDGVYNQDQANLHFNAPADIVFVEHLYGWGGLPLLLGGVTDGYDLHRIIIEWGTGTSMLAHEIGHGVGLRHFGHGTGFIMNGTPGTYSHLLLSDVANYESGVSGGPP